MLKAALEWNIAQMEGAVGLIETGRAHHGVKLLRIAVTQAKLALKREQLTGGQRGRDRPLHPVPSDRS